MSYDAKNRPVFLGFEKDRTNPNRLTQGVLSVADDKSNQIEPIPQPPSTIEKLMSGGKIIALILAGLSATVLGLQESGIVLPAAILSIAKVIAAIAATLGIASGGLKKPSASDEPKVGPPAP
jgi:hypothetical protein